MVQLRAGAVIDVESDAEVRERLLADGMVLIDQRLRGDAVLPCAERDGGPVLIRTADEHRVLALQFQVAGVDVSRQICPGQMAEVDRAVDIRQRGSDEVAFRLVHIIRIDSANLRPLWWECKDRIRPMCLTLLNTHAAHEDRHHHPEKATCRAHHADRSEQGSRPDR